MFRHAGDGFGRRVTGIGQRKHDLFGQQEGRCVGCQYDIPFRNFTVDHVLPPSNGGTDHLGNLRILGSACNSLKGDRTQEFLIGRLI